MTTILEVVREWRKRSWHGSTRHWIGFTLLIMRRSYTIRNLEHQL
jgi:hypothetical protein